MPKLISRIIRFILQTKYVSKKIRYKFRYINNFACNLITCKNVVLNNYS